MLHLSELGHRNFVYPSDETLVLQQDCKAERMCWVGSNTLIPMKLDSEDIVKDSSTGSVVWVDKKSISKGA